MCKHCPGVEDCAHDRATDTWLTPRQPVFLPPLEPDRPEDVHQPQMGRDGGESSAR